MDREHYAATCRLRENQGLMLANLECFGDTLAKREKYKVHRGLEAVHFYLVQKHGWLPSQVQSLNYEDLSFLLAEEKAGWTLPKELLNGEAGPRAQGPSTAEPAGQASGPEGDSSGGKGRPNRQKLQRVSQLKT